MSEYQSNTESLQSQISAAEAGGAGGGAGGGAIEQENERLRRELSSLEARDQVERKCCAHVWSDAEGSDTGFAGGRTSWRGCGRRRWWWRT